MIAHVATCVAIAGRGVLIEGPPGCGKSALALTLIDRGAQLVGDDGVLLERVGDRLLARPHPNTHGLLEIRNLGLVRFSVCEEAQVALLIRLDDDAPRFIEQPETVERLGVAVHSLAIWPDSTPPALKVEQALRWYDLS